MRENSRPTKFTVQEEKRECLKIFLKKRSIDNIMKQKKLKWLEDIWIDRLVY